MTSAFPVVRIGRLKYDQASQRIAGELPEETDLSSFQYPCLSEMSNHQAPGELEAALAHFSGGLASVTSLPCMMQEENP